MRTSGVLEVINYCLNNAALLTKGEALFLEDLEIQLSDGIPASNEQIQYTLRIRAKIKETLNEQH